MTAQMTARPSDKTRQKLRHAGLRPTRQRVALADLLFAAGHRHVTAEALHEEAVAGDQSVSLATVYNTLHQFTEVGLLKAVPVDGSRTYFDTNTSDHHHFYTEPGGELIDVPGDAMKIVGVPEAPSGMEVVSVDVVVRVRPRQSD